MVKTVRETIKFIVKDHLLKFNGLVFGQCLTAVGWVGGTLPELYEKEGMIELATSDVSNGGIVVGAGLMNKRPIYIIRYQGFNWYNCPMIINYACKSKEIWKVPCPIFIRSIGMEGGIGPVAGSSHHSLYYRMPGIKIASPMTPKEYLSVYKKFMKDDDVYYISEHRKSYGNSLELKDILNHNRFDIIIFAISITRFESLKAKKILNKKGIKVGIANILWLKPLKIKKLWLQALIKSKSGGIVIDDDYEDGVAKNIANDLSILSGKKIYTMGLKNRTAGFHSKVDNLPPSSADISKKILKILRLNSSYKK